MPDSSYDIQMDQINAFLLDLLRFRRRTMAMMPEEILQVKERLDKMYLQDALIRNMPDHDVFFRIGVVILSRHKDPISMGNLSKELDVPLSTATRIVDGLVDNGLAERVPDADDRRIVRVTLTARGRELHQMMNAFLRQRIEQILQHFTAEEREQLVFLLQKVAAAFAESEEAQQ